MLRNRMSIIVPVVALAALCVPTVFAQPAPPSPPPPPPPPPPLYHELAAYLLEDQPRARIGIALGIVGEPLAAHLGVDPQEVALIVNVTEGDAGEEAGLQRFDVITSIDGISPVTADVIRHHVRDKEPGDEIALSIIRAARPMEVVITLGEARPPQWLERSRDEVTREVEFLRHRLGDAGELRGAIEAEMRRLRTHRPEFEQHMHRLREEGDLLRQSLHRQWLEFREDMELDEETREKLKHALEAAAERTSMAMERAAEALSRAQIRVDVDAPRVEIRPEGRARGMVVLPEGEAQRGHGTYRLRPQRDGDGPPPEMMERRVRRMEERLERIERMLERLTERDGSE